MSLRDFVKEQRKIHRLTQADLARLNDIKPVFENMIEESFLNERLINRFLGIYRKRMERFFG